tara:strand:- start:275 stop:409 length:135 start_codon:yes stop_codon:yes gene_type:complete
MKCARQRWTVTPSTLAAATFSPLWLSAMIRIVLDGLRGEDSIAE